MFCKREIVMSDRTSGNWLPYDLNGEIHDCKNTTKSTGPKKVETKELTLEERVKRLESIVIDPRK